MFSLPGILSSSVTEPPLVTPVSTILYMRGDTLTDLSTSAPKNVLNTLNVNNQITFDTNDTIYSSRASMIIPFAPTSYLKYGARINNVNLGNNTWTIEMWLKNTTSEPRLNIFTFTPATNPSNMQEARPFLAEFAQYFCFWENGGTVRIIDPFTTNTWTHLAICRNSGNILKMFKNGVQFYSAAYSRDNSTYTSFFLGAKVYGAGEEVARGPAKIAHLHIATMAYYTANFTANKAAGFY